MQVSVPSGLYATIVKFIDLSFLFLSVFFFHHGAIVTVFAVVYVTVAHRAGVTALIRGQWCAAHYSVHLVKDSRLVTISSM